MLSYLSVPLDCLTWLEREVNFVSDQNWLFLVDIYLFCLLKWCVYTEIFSKAKNNTDEFRKHNDLFKLNSNSTDEKIYMINRSENADR